MSDLDLTKYTKAGKIRKMGPEGGRPPVPDDERRKPRRTGLSDRELRERGWDGVEPVHGFLRRLVLSIEPGRPLGEVLDVE